MDDSPFMPSKGNFPSYLRADKDPEFLSRDELRAIRLQLEWFKPELIQQDEGIHSTIVVFGSARVPDPEIAQQNRDYRKGCEREQPKDARWSLI